MTEPTDAGPNPCPFCGSSNIVHYEVEGRANHFFECCECLAASMCKTTHQEALAAWNRCTPQPTQAQGWPPKSWIDEVRGYLTAAADSSMSRNNSEQLASELLEQMPTQAQAGAVPRDVTPPEDAMLRNAARRSSKLIANGGQHGPT